MANKFVDEISGDNGNGGGAFNDAYKTLDFAYFNITSGDTIWIMTDLTPLGQTGTSDWHQNFGRAGIDVTLAPYNNGTFTITCNFAGSYGFFMNPSATTSKLTIDKGLSLDFTGCQSGILKTAQGGVPTGSLVLNGNIDVGNDNSSTFALQIFDIIELYVTGIISGGDVATVEVLGASTSLYFDGITLTNTRAGAYGIRVGGTSPTVDFITVLGGSTFDTEFTEIFISDVKGGTTNELCSVYVAGNTLTRSGVGVQPNISLGIEYGNATLWTNAGLSVSVDDAYRLTGEVYRAISAHLTADATKPGVGADWRTAWVINRTITGTIEKNDITGISDNHCVGTFYGTTNVHVLFNELTDGDFGVVVKGDGAVVYGNLINSDVPVFVSGNSALIRNNALYAENDTSCVVLGDEDGKFGENSSVLNNIINQPGTGYCFTDDSDTVDRNHYFDNNIYFKPSGALFQMNGAERDDLPAQRTQWQAQSLQHIMNDQNSTVQNTGDATGIIVDGEWIGIPQDIPSNNRFATANRF